MWWIKDIKDIKDIRVAHLIDEELQLENSGAALVLAVGVHPRPSQSDGVPKVKEAQRRHIVDRVRLSF